MCGGTTHKYKRSAIMDYYCITKDKKIGNKNDPNAGFANPCDFITAVERIVHTSAETARIIRALSPVFED